MALETWLIKVKTAISNNFHEPKTKPTKKSNKLGILAFEFSTLMTKLLHLWNSLSDKNITRLQNHSLSLEGVHKLVSDDKSFLLHLARAEMTENLRLIAKSVSRISQKCEDVNLKRFEFLFNEFENSGIDPHNWVLSGKEMEFRNKKTMNKFVTFTAKLYKEMDELSMMEIGFRKALTLDQQKNINIIDLEQKVLWKRQEVKNLKEKSLWNRSFDNVTSILVRPIFTILSKIKLVFGLEQYRASHDLPRFSANSATVYPSDQNPSSDDQNKDFPTGFFESNSKILKPAENTLGYAGLALHYANLIIVIEKMIKSPHLIGFEARDDLYNMLPNSIRCSLRDRLKRVGFKATDKNLVVEWREALRKILGWFLPLGVNMIKWQSERSFEKEKMVNKKSNVMLLESLYFADKEKSEQVIVELLVGLNYIWRFEMEMSAKALLESSNFNGMENLQNGPYS